jgi:hypothetical protein
MSLGENGILGIALGTSEAAGRRLSCLSRGLPKDGTKELNPQLHIQSPFRFHSQWKVDVICRGVLSLLRPKHQPSLGLPSLVSDEGLT